MKNKLSAVELRNRVLALQEQKETQEQLLKDAFQHVVFSLNPVQVAKTTLHKLSEDQQVRADLATLSMTLGLRILMRTFISRKRSPAIYVAALAMEQVALPLLREHWPLVKVMAKRFSSPDETNSE